MTWPDDDVALVWLPLTSTMRGGSLGMRVPSKYACAEKETSMKTEPDARIPAHFECNRQPRCSQSSSYQWLNVASPRLCGEELDDAPAVFFDHVPSAEVHDRGVGLRPRGAQAALHDAQQHLRGGGRGAAAAARGEAPLRRLA